MKATQQQLVEQLNTIALQTDALHMLVAKDALTEQEIYAHARLIAGNIGTVVAWTEPEVETYHVRDNVTDSVMSKNYTALDSAYRVCAGMNLQAGPGGRYGVYNSKGERA
jgi:hypothetical protein